MCLVPPWCIRNLVGCSRNVVVTERWLEISVLQVALVGSWVSPCFFGLRILRSKLARPTVQVANTRRYRSKCRTPTISLTTGNAKYSRLCGPVCVGFFFRVVPPRIARLNTTYASARGGCPTHSRLYSDF